MTHLTVPDHTLVAAHTQLFTHRYGVHFPEHDPRASDPHKHDFDEWKRRRKASNTYYCDFAHQHRNGDTSECDTTHPLEAHHSHVELALMNGVDIVLLEIDYPGISKQEIGAWIDGEHNLELLCQVHHRGLGGKHLVTVADFEGEKYIHNLFVRYQALKGATS